MASDNLETIFLLIKAGRFHFLAAGLLMFKSPKSTKSIKYPQIYFQIKK